MSTVETIKEKLNIEDVVSRYIKLEKAGASMKAKCPFHNEKTPSFFISPARGTYYCFGCGAKGDIFTFVEEFERVDFKGALKILADIAGVEIVPEKPSDQESKSEKERLFAIMEEAARFYEANLAAGEGKTSIEYLVGRSLKERIIKEWRLGLAKEAWGELLEHLKKKGFREGDIEKAGLIKRGDRGSFYDRFRGRIMFPLFDSSGRVIAFSGRILEAPPALRRSLSVGESRQSFGEPKEAKYINSPETPLFNKSEVLYGYDRAKNAIREQDYAILVEGQMDLIMLHQVGLKNSVASSGTALTEKHLKILKRSSENLLLAYDGDSAGLQAALRAWLLALNLGMEIKIASFPKGEDPASLAAKSVDKLKEVLKNSKHIINFYLDVILETITDRRKLVKEIEKELLPFVRSLPSSIDQIHFISIISDKTGIPEGALIAELNKISVEEEAEKGNLKVVANKGDFRERRLWGMISWQEKEKEPRLDINGVRERIKSSLGEDGLKRLDSLGEEEKAELVFEAEVYYAEAAALKEEAEELLSYLEEDYLKEQFEKAMMELQRAERDKKVAEAEKLLKRCQELSEKISAHKKFAYPISL